jgi:hypothetical protein
MILRHRSATAADLMGGREVLAPAYGNDPDVLSRFGEAWECLLQSDAGRAALVEDVTNPASPRPIAYGGRVFVSPDFADELREGRQGPTAAGHILRRVLEGGEGILTPDAIREAQTGEGLHLVLMHAAFTECGPGRFGSVEEMESLTFIFFHHHRGYRLRECMKDVLSPREYQWFGQGGFRRRTDYADGTREEPTADLPFLLSIQRDEALANPGARFAAVFAEHPQRLGLRAIHRELLASALEGRSDEEIALQLCISISTVKKRWVAVYDHVDRVLPGLLPNTDTLMTGTRGTERRRHLLAYLREHPEEFVPLVD